MRWLVCLLVLLASVAHAQIPGFPSGAFSNKAASDPALLPGYVGVGDIAAQTYWYSAPRAYSAATRGAALMNVCNSTGGVDVGCADVLSDATTGAAVPKTISGLSCSGANCTIKTYYNLANPGTIDQTLSTVAQRSVWTANCVATIPCGVSGSGYYRTAITSIPQPYSLSLVAARTGAFTSESIALAAFLNLPGTGPILEFTTSANTMGWFCGNGSFATHAATDNAVHALQLACIGATDNAVLDGTPLSGAWGTHATDTEISIAGVTSGAGNALLTGQFFEGGLRNADLSSSQAAIDANQRNFY